MQTSCWMLWNTTPSLFLIASNNANCYAHVLESDGLIKLLDTRWCQSAHPCNNKQNPTRPTYYLDQMLHFLEHGLQRKSWVQKCNVQQCISLLSAWCSCMRGWLTLWTVPKILQHGTAAIWNPDRAPVAAASTQLPMRNDLTWPDPPQPSFTLHTELHESLQCQCTALQRMYNCWALRPIGSS